MDSLLLQMRGKVKSFSDGRSNLGFIYEVDDHTITIKKYRGRRRISCSCQNCARFVNESSICKYKIAAILEYIKLTNGTN